MPCPPARASSLPEHPSPTLPRRSGCQARRLARASSILPPLRRYGCASRAPSCTRPRMRRTPPSPNPFAPDPFCRSKDRSPSLHLPIPARARDLANLPIPLCNAPRLCVCRPSSLIVKRAPIFQGLGGIRGALDRGRRVDAPRLRDRPHRRDKRCAALALPLAPMCVLGARVRTCGALGVRAHFVRYDSAARHALLR